MSDKTSIEWTDATWNPVSGCEKVSEGCRNCYAERLFPRVYGGRKDWPAVDGEGRPGMRDRRFTDVKVHRDRFDQPLRWRKPRRVFVNSMSDLFHPDVPFVVIDELADIMERCPQHTFQILTKRPDRMLVWKGGESGAGLDQSLQLDSHIWWGISAEDQATADERIPLLLQMPAAVRFVSLEPLLGPVDLRDIVTRLSGGGEEHRDALFCDVDPSDDIEWRGRTIDWVIVGGESGPGARPMHPDWVRSVRDQCVAAGVPFFFKQWGEWAPAGGATIYGDRWFAGNRGDTRVRRVGKKRAGRELDGRTWDEMPEVR